MVEVEYKGESLSYDMWTRPIWDWCCKLLDDQSIVSQFHWDAEHHYRLEGDEGNKIERFIDEPWTADSWWKIQVRDMA